MCNFVGHAYHMQAVQRIIVLMYELIDFFGDISMKDINIPNICKVGLGRMDCN